MGRWISWVELLEMIAESKSVIVKQSYISECSDDVGLRLALLYSTNEKPPTITVNDLIKGDCSAFETAPHFYNIFDCLSYLQSNPIPSKAAIQNIRFFLTQTSPNKKDTFIKLLTQTMDIGLTIAQINAVIPNLITKANQSKQKSRLICRGMTKDREWIEGYFFKALKDRVKTAYILPENESIDKAVEVIASSVGERTDFFDINGSPIFEGNILEVSGFASPGIVVFNGLIQEFICKFREDDTRLVQDIYNVSKVIGSIFVSAF